jgi:hypothetical protein
MAGAERWFTGGFGKSHGECLKSFFVSVVGMVIYVTRR